MLVIPQWPLSQTNARIEVNVVDVNRERIEKWNSKI